MPAYVTKTRDKKAALAFIKKALKRHGSVETITTDGLRSYGAAMEELGNREKQEIGRWANNRVENSWTCNGLVPVTCLSLCHLSFESQGAYAAQI